MKRAPANTNRLGGVFILTGDTYRPPFDYPSLDYPSLDHPSSNTYRPVRKGKARRTLVRGYVATVALKPSTLTYNFLSRLTITTFQ